MIKWNCKLYCDLSLNELYSILKIRQEVFIIEQNCNYLDADGYDVNSTHLFAYKNDKIIAYMRIIDSEEIPNHVIFGRILVKKEFRNIGLGKEIMKRGIALFDPKQTIFMSAQVYLKEFYQSFNFISIGDEYFEDDIPHIKMIRNG